MVDRLEALQTIRVGLEETCAHLTTQLFAAERRLKEAEAAGAVLIDPLFALGVELQRLRERVAELEEHVRKGDRFIGAVERAEKAEAQVAELRWALTRLILECDDAFDGDGPTGLIPGGVAYDDARAALAATPAPTRAEAEAWLRAGEPVRGALAVPAEPDYSGLCSAPSCEGHCGYVHARGCEAVREYLADHGGDPYRAPSPPDILRRVAERARERIAALAYDAGRPDLCARVRAIDLNALLDGGE